MNIPAEWKQLLDELSLPVMILDRDLRFRYFNQVYLKTVHRPEEDLLGQYVFDAFPETPERIESVMEPWRRTLQGEVTVLESLPFHVEMEDGSIEERVWQATQDPIRDDNGKVIGLMQRAQDITEQFRLEQRNKAISYELSHRVKNIMAVVSSVARITGRNASDVGAFVKSFTNRLNAMSRTNDLLAEQNWIGLDVRTILQNELSPFDKTDSPVYTLSGKQVLLAIGASKDLSMATHELVTNATKYGALGQAGGHLYLHWERDGDRLIIDWQEECPNPVTPSDVIGFGTQLFDMLPYANVTRNFTPKGLHLIIEMDGKEVFA